MSTDPNSEKATHASLWQAVCWMAYDNFDVHEPVDDDRTLHEDVTLAFNTSGHKVALLEAISDAKVRFEGRLGVRCDPPPSLSDTWREYCWAGHVETHSSIEPQDWPSDYADTAIDWTASSLRTPRGEFLDVRAARDSVRSWHPGPHGELVPVLGQAPPPAAEADSALRAGAVPIEPVAPAPPSNLTNETRSKGGSKPHYNAGFQQFIDRLFDELEKGGGRRLILSRLKIWLEENALPGQDYETGIPNCDDIEFHQNKIWWKNRKGDSKSIVFKSADRYIARARDDTSRKIRLAEYSRS